MTECVRWRKSFHFWGDVFAFRSFMEWWFTRRNLCQNLHQTNCLVMGLYSSTTSSVAETKAREGLSWSNEKWAFSLVSRHQQKSSREREKEHLREVGECSFRSILVHAVTRHSKRFTKPKRMKRRSCLVMVHMFTLFYESCPTMLSTALTLVWNQPTSDGKHPK